MNKSDTIAIEILTSNKSLEDDFETLGMQLDSLETVNQPTKMRTWMAEGIDFTKQIREVFIIKAKDFLKKYGENILKETCDWWNKNKDKAYDTSSMIGFWCCRWCCCISCCNTNQSRIKYCLPKWRQS